MQWCITWAACQDKRTEGRLQVDVVLVDLEVTNAMRAIQDTIRVELARAAIDAAVEELFKSEFGVAYDCLQARAEQDDYLPTQGTGAADALVEASLRTIFTGTVVDQGLQGEWDSRRSALEKGRMAGRRRWQPSKQLEPGASWSSHIRAACAGLRQWQASAIASAKTLRAGSRG